jgi:hypothetical protein
MKRLIPLAALLMFSGCSGISDAYVAADRATFNAVHAEYLRWARQAFQAGEIDEAQLGTRKRTVDTWRMRIESAEVKK